ncbi:FAD-dependent oxidoreductase [Streptomyces lincolnensis]|uniref:FAD-dependent oxidoreductase n=1 Tax=Streptomyces lincolnensis TaxID=1915 RepID=UPI0037D6BAC1
MAIIGAGLTALSAALHLARKGANVHVFDKDTVGFGASGRNGGMATTEVIPQLTQARVDYCWRGLVDMSPPGRSSRNVCRELPGPVTPLTPEQRDRLTALLRRKPTEAKPIAAQGPVTQKRSAGRADEPRSPQGRVRRCRRQRPSGAPHRRR